MQWMQCPTNSQRPQIRPMSEVLGQVLGVSQRPQVTAVQGATLWPSDRSILVHCKAVAQIGAKLVKLVHGL